MGRRFFVKALPLAADSDGMSNATIPAIPASAIAKREENRVQAAAALIEERKAIVAQILTALRNRFSKKGE